MLSGGELTASVLAYALASIIPGVLNDVSSALSDSYQYELLSPPVYTRPYDYKGHKVPDILLSGNEKEIKEWKLQKAIEKTRKKRPDLLQNYDAES